MSGLLGRLCSTGATNKDNEDDNNMDKGISGQGYDSAEHKPSDIHAPRSKDVHQNIPTVLDKPANVHGDEHNVLNKDKIIDRNINTSTHNDDINKNIIADKNMNINTHNDDINRNKNIITDKNTNINTHNDNINKNIIADNNMNINTHNDNINRNMATDKNMNINPHNNNMNINPHNNDMNKNIVADRITNVYGDNSGMHKNTIEHSNDGDAINNNHSYGINDNSGIQHHNKNLNSVLNLKGFEKLNLEELYPTGSMGIGADGRDRVKEYIHNYDKEYSGPSHYPSGHAFPSTSSSSSSPLHLSDSSNSSKQNVLNLL